MRKSAEQYFGYICKATASRATCEKIKVGAILTLDHYIISSGMNGAPKGFEHCTDVGCVLDAYKKCQRCVHAEINCLIHAQQTKGTELWSTHLPCIACCHAIINAGVIRVSFLEYYFDPKCSVFPNYSDERNYQLDLLNRAGIETQLIRL